MPPVGGSAANFEAAEGASSSSGVESGARSAAPPAALPATGVIRPLPLAGRKSIFRDALMNQVSAAATGNPYDDDELPDLKAISSSDEDSDSASDSDSDSDSDLETIPMHPLFKRGAFHRKRGQRARRKVRADTPRPSPVHASSAGAVLRCPASAGAVLLGTPPSAAAVLPCPPSSAGAVLPCPPSSSSAVLPGTPPSADHVLPCPPSSSSAVLPCPPSSSSAVLPSSAGASDSEMSFSDQQQEVRSRKAVLKARFARGTSKKASKEASAFGLQRRGVKRQGQTSAKTKALVREHQVQAEVAENDRRSRKEFLAGAVRPGPNKTSKCWKHFNILPATRSKHGGKRAKAICIHCGHGYDMIHGTNNMRNHLIKKHPEAWMAVDDSAVGTALPPPISGQRDLEGHITKAPDFFMSAIRWQVMECLSFDALHNHTTSNR